MLLHFATYDCVNLPIVSFSGLLNFGLYCAVFYRKQLVRDQYLSTGYEKECNGVKNRKAYVLVTLSLNVCSQIKPEADPGIPKGVANPKGCINLLFGKTFLKRLHRLKEIPLRGRWVSLSPP